MQAICKHTLQYELVYSLVFGFDGIQHIQTTCILFQHSKATYSNPRPRPFALPPPPIGFSHSMSISSLDIENDYRKATCLIGNAQ